MGIFYRTDQSRRYPDATTIIAPGTRIIGDIESSGGVHIDGEVLGNIRAANYVIVAAGGSVQGDIRAKEVYIGGIVKGEVWALEVDLLQGGVCAGKIEATKVNRI